jgi:hypothetical protein
MSVRKLSLQEWFLYYQLKNIQKSHFHLPGSIQVDMSRVAKHYKDQGVRVPITPIIIKAASLLTKECPEINTQFFETIFGTKMLDYSYNAVNVPVMMNINGEDYLSAMVIKDAHELSIKEIKSQIKDFKNSKKEDLKVGKFIVGKSNNLFNRTRLKFIHFIISNFPHLQEKFGAGSISVSSLLGKNSNSSNIDIVAKGQNAITMCATTYDEETSILNMGLSWDHYTGHGMKYINSSTLLNEILKAEKDEYFEVLTK